MITFSEEQATALVTDPGTLKRGQELVSPAKWANLGRTDAAAWGECAGSGSKPYLTGIDLTEPAFKCSCPSRVFPCKHGAGLLLLLARQPALLAPGQPPAWLAEWLTKRQSKNEEQVEKAAAKATKKPAAEPASTPAEASELATTDAAPPTRNAQQKRETQRLARMQAGAADLEAWLLDLLRAGLADLASKPASLWENQAARLVDNQLPGLAATLRELADYPTAGPTWADRLLGRLGELYVLVRAFLNRENLAPTAWQDVAQQVGLTLKKEALLTDPGALALADTWLVLGLHTWPEERLMGRRSWLYGQHSGRLALLLEFAFGSQPFATPLVPLGRYGGELVFYPSLLRLRAVPSAGLTRQADAPGGRPAPRPLAGLLDAYAASLARQPWLRELPATVWAVVGRSAAGTWHLHDPDTGAALPLRLPDEQPGWPLLALSGGQPRAWFGEWDGQAFRVLSHWPAAPADVLPSTASPTPGAEAPLAPPPTNPWPALLRVALLGTRQNTEALPNLNLGDFPQAAGREQQLLLTAGTLALLRKAGLQPLGSPLPAPAPPETQPLLGPAGQALLRQLLSRPHYHPLLRQYLQDMGAHRRVVPPAMLPAVLGWVKAQPETAPFAAATLGERGRWLASQNPDWQFILDTTNEQPTEADWRTGSAPRRRLYLEQQLLADPSHAAQLLTEALPQEPAAAQVALLGALEAWPLAAPLPTELAPLLAPLLASRAKEVRQTAARWLARTTANELLPRLWARAEPLLHFKRELLGRNSLEISLPTWSAEWQRDGIEQKSTDYPGGEKAAQLGQLLALLPPSHWTAAWGVPAAEAVALAAASEWASVLLPAWLRAARRHHDADFALALLLREASQPSLPPKSRLLTEAAEVLSAAQRENWLLAALPIAAAALPTSNGWAHWLPLAAQPWPEALWRRALPLLRAALRQPPSWAPEQTDLDQAVRSLLLALGSAAAPDLLARLTAGLGELTEVQPRFTDDVAQALELLALRPRLAVSLLEEVTD